MMNKNEYKIGILTFQNTTNYGAVLQNFALQKAIENLNVECEVINYHCYNIEERECTIFPHFNKNIINYLINIRRYLKQSKKRYVINNFKNKNIIFSKTDYYKNNIKDANKEYSIFIVGSDMVWELGITGGDINYYLDFADENKRYSYAASIGTEKLNELYEDKCIENLNKFKYISVRELQAKKILENYISKDISVDVDPTLLHDKKFWIHYEEIPKIINNKKYILLYFIDSNGIILTNAKKIAKENDLDIYILKDNKKEIDGCKIICNATVGEFLYYIHNAELVITGSYHGMIFSMNYNTNFMYYNRANSSRMDSIAELTGSTNRKMTEDYIPELKCNFEVINKSISNLRDKSMENLEKIVNNNFHI